MTGVLVSVSGSVGTAGCRFFCWDGEGRQRKVASLRGVDAVGGVFEVLWGGWKRTGRPVLKCQTGTEYSYKYRRIQKQDRPSVSP